MKCETNKSKTKSRTRVFTLLKLLISSSLSSKSNILKFSRTRSTFVLFGIVEIPRCTICRNRIYNNRYFLRLLFTYDITSPKQNFKISRLSDTDQVAELAHASKYTMIKWRRVSFGSPCKCGRGALGIECLAERIGWEKISAQADFSNLLLQNVSPFFEEEGERIPNCLRNLKFIGRVMYDARE
uniref:Uncharacterized protein n=1 Tax=Parascaris univalens TaxID=6257 RepID=A0A915CCK7_PARUN